MFRSLLLPAAAAVTSALCFVAPDARACGGCFVPPSSSTVVNGHRMALAVSPDQTVLWDQIEYAGDPAEFAWVLPVARGASPSSRRPAGASSTAATRRASSQT